IDAEQFRGFELLDVPEKEPAAANVLPVGDVVIVPALFQKTHRLLEERGFRVRPIDVSELQKAEAGVTCCSLIFDDTQRKDALPRDHGVAAATPSPILSGSPD